MKVLMINGSSRNNGCTRAALDIMAETFKEEGIETEEQYSEMERLGINYIQGFYFSKPLPEEEFIHFLMTH